MASRGYSRNRLAVSRWSVVALVLSVCLSVGMGIGGWSGALGMTAQVSPANGHAAVIANGVSALPEGQIAWRANREVPVADPLNNPVNSPGPGFIVAHGGPLLVAEASDRQAALLPGEGVFVPAAPVRVAALDPAKTADYFHFELVPASAKANGSTFFTSQPFAAPAGQRDLNLVRDVLEQDETTTVIGQNAPVLVLALENAIGVQATDGTSATLKAGEAREFTGDVVIKGADQGAATFVAAVIGPVIPTELPTAATAAATPQPASQPASASDGVVAVVLHGCPKGVNAKSADPNSCPLNPDAVSLHLYQFTNGQVENLGAPKSRDGLPVWTGLGTGDYAIVPARLGSGFTRIAIPGLSAPEGADLSALGDTPDGAFVVHLTPDAPSVRLDVYALAGKDNAGGGNGGNGSSGNDGGNGNKQTEAIAIGTPVATATPEQTAGGGVRDVGSAQPANQTPAGENNQDQNQNQSAIRQISGDGATATETPVATVAVAKPRRGSITLTLLQCAEDADNFQPTLCTPPTGPFELSFKTPDGDTIGMDAARQEDDGSLIWENLPFGNYVLQQPVFPPGSATYYIPDGELAPSNDGYLITLDAAAPRVQTRVFDLAPAPVPTPAPVEVAPAPAPVEAAPASTENTIDVGPPPTSDSTAAPPADTTAPAPDTQAPPADQTDTTGAGAAPADTGAAAPQADTAPVDTDLDGLSDADEAAVGTDATDPDSDKDGWLDGNETNLGTNPLDPASFPQT